MRVVAIIQARMGSSRLPGKVMKPVLGRPLILSMLERVRGARTLDEIVVATTTASEDDAVATLMEEHGFACFRGHATDLLDRHLQARRAANASAVVKIPSDCPLIDPRVIDRVIAAFRAHPEEYDFVSNLHPATYPDGNDVEVIPMHALELGWQEATCPFEREHTTPFFWERPERFRINNVTWETGLDYSMSHRFTIDYPDDLAFVTAVFEGLHLPGAPPFSLNEILSFLDQRPDVFRLNSYLAGVNWYRNHLGELRTVSAKHTVRLESP